MDKNRKKWVILLVFFIVWITVLSAFYVQLPQLIPVQFSLSGEVSGYGYKSAFYALVFIIFSLYLIYTAVRYKNKAIPNKNLFTLYFVMAFSVFVLVLGNLVT